MTACLDIEHKIRAERGSTTLLCVYKLIHHPGVNKLIENGPFILMYLHNPASTLHYT